MKNAFLRNTLNLGRGVFYRAIHP